MSIPERADAEIRSCNATVILESKKRNFTIRALNADQKGDQGLNSWDLSIFRLPRSEKFQKAVKNEKVKTLELKFADVNGKPKGMSCCSNEANALQKRTYFSKNSHHSSIAGQLIKMIMRRA